MLMEQVITRTEVRVTFFPSGRATAHRMFPNIDLARAFRVWR